MNIQAPTNELVQSQFYNGWTHGHYVSNVFVFAPDGKIICCVINAPGSFHDSTVSEYGIYDKLDFLYKEYNAKTVADSSFIGTRPNLVLSGDEHTTTTEQELLLKRLEKRYNVNSADGRMGDAANQSQVFETLSSSYSFGR
jgi:hypothetical protein